MLRPPNLRDIPRSRRRPSEQLPVYYRTGRGLLKPPAPARAESRNQADGRRACLSKGSMHPRSVVPRQLRQLRQLRTVSPQLVRDEPPLATRQQPTTHRPDEWAFQPSASVAVAAPSGPRCVSGAVRQPLRRASGPAQHGSQALPADPRPGGRLALLRAIADRSALGSAPLPDSLERALHAHAEGVQRWSSWSNVTIKCIWAPASRGRCPAGVAEC